MLKVTGKAASWSAYFIVNSVNEAGSIAALAISQGLSNAL
jgi:hypothetical protein